MIYVEFDRGRPGSDVPSGLLFRVLYGAKNNCYSNYICYYGEDDIGVGITTYGVAATIYGKSIAVRSTSTYPGTAILNHVRIIMFGNFNYDEISIENYGTFDRRVEVRNENGVLITDNGLPWGDGTYPPDAKNRAGLAGLHAAVINTKVDDALTGDVSNKEAEMIGAERGAGVQYALDKDDNNGL